MRAILLLTTTFLLGLRAAGAATTPMDAPLPDDKVTRIETDYALTEDDVVRISGPLTAAVKKDWADQLGTVGKSLSWHYDLYVPPGYGENKDRRYPCVFIASPGGNASLGAMKDCVRREEWIAVMLVESKNSSPDWLASFCSAHDDVLKRARVLDGWKMGTGQSGGARCSSAYPLLRPGFRGVFFQAAGIFDGASVGFYNYLADEAAEGRQYIVYGSFGKTDFNLYEGVSIRSMMRPVVVRNVEVFDGGHAWAPAPIVDRAFAWFERMAFFTLPPRKEDVPLAKILLARRESALEKAEGFAKYELLEAAAALVTRYKMGEGKDGDKTLAEKAKAWTTALKELAKDETVKKELKARDEFRKVEAKETPPYEPMDPKKVKPAKKPKKSEKAPPPRRTATAGGDTQALRDKWAKDKATLPGFATEYRAMAKKFDGTVYAALAEARATSLDMEAKAVLK